ncbi:Hypothetical protein, putative [Bodo saltans]|uniref:PH domain-containing protein n=1 Tax=Bodo saltans TaxID=75058 RepID=A0A0S4JDS6_BODSA|nr:Hypothetical protein, putative [Bodo saltans]|eukprot:CUG88272.1 Hypothetical protein, putative [Bodo saltans]
MSYRERLVAFYEQYAPAKLPTVDAILTKYEGREEELLQALIAKQNSAQSAGSGNYRARVEAMYRTYAADKLDNVDAVLTKYQGSEEILLEALVKKYGPEPTPTALPSSPLKGAAPADAGSYRSRIIAMYEKYAPAKVSSVDASLEKYRGSEDALIEALVKKYGPEPTVGLSSSSSNYRERVLAMYTKYAPEKAETVDTVMEKYKGSEDALIEALVKKYGPEPSAGAASVAPVPTPSSPAAAPLSPPSSPPMVAGSPSRGGDYRSRVIALYEKYAPAKLNTVDAAMEKYQGAEDALIEALVKKYGPEPEAGASTASAPAAASPAPASSAAAAATPSKAGDYRNRIVALYEKYAPGKLGTVDSALEKYQGAEDALIDALVKKYGPEPEAGATAVTPAAATPVAASAAPAAASATPAAASSPRGDYRSRIVALYEKYAPGKVGTVDAALEKYQGAEDALIDALVKKYGPEPEPTTAPSSGGNYRARLVALYEAYAPAKLNSIDGALEKYKGSEDALIEALVMKYGPEPSAAAAVNSTPTAASPSAAAAASPVNQELANRVQAMYACYQPDKQEQVPKLLEKYRGEEMQLLKSLVQRYGPEPMGAGNVQLAALERDLNNARRLTEVEWEEPCASKFLEHAIYLSREAKRIWDSRTTVVNTEGKQRIAIEAEWHSAIGTFEKSIPKCPLHANRSLMKSFFECLGTANAGSQPTIDEGTFFLLLECICVGSEFLPPSIRFPMAFEQFFSVLVSTCHDSTTLLERMEEFVHVASSGQANRSESAAPAPSGTTTAATPRATQVHRSVDVTSGFWAHKCVFPSVLEHWSRVWVVYHDDAKKLTWSSANSTKVQGSIPVSHMLRVRLSAMISPNAPRKFAKNGISVQLTEGANPLLVSLCPESIDCTHELLQVLRKAKQRSERIATEQRRNESARGAPPPSTPRYAFTTVWCCRSGFDTFSRTLWTVAGDRVIHKATDADRESYWLLSDVIDVSAAPLQGLKAPAKYKSFGFTIKFRGGALFCCAEGPTERDELVDSLKKGLFRQYIANHARSSSPTRKDDSLLRSSSATPGSPVPKISSRR